MKPDFDKCEKLATQLLLQQTPSSLYIDVRKLKYDIPICFDTFQHYSTITGAPILSLKGAEEMLKDGCTIKTHGINIILYNQSAEWFPERLNWTLAHEVGHIYSNHEEDGCKEEIEANWFAAQLLMHENILRDLADLNKGLCVREIERVFKVSATAAQNRLKSLSKKVCWFYGEEEQELLRRYRPLEYKALDDLAISWNAMIG